MNGCPFLCVSPEIDCRPVQAVAYISPGVSWDRLQPTLKTLKDKQIYLMDGWMDVQRLLCF